MITKAKTSSCLLFGALMIVVCHFMGWPQLAVAFGLTGAALDLRESRGVTAMIVRGFELEHDANMRAYTIWTHHEAGEPRILLQVHYDGTSGRKSAHAKAIALAKTWCDVFRVDMWEASDTRH